MFVFVSCSFFLCSVGCLCVWLHDCLGVLFGGLFVCVCPLAFFQMRLLVRSPVSSSACPRAHMCMVVIGVMRGCLFACLLVRLSVCACFVF